MNPFSLRDDDHYILNNKNAHIDTSRFEQEVLAELRKTPEIDDRQLAELAYLNAFSRTAVPPEEPSDDTLLCRYLSPSKFIQFLDTRKIAFPTANQFADRWECKVPEDYNTAVLKLLAKNDCSGEVWANYVRSKAATWNISCWTELRNNIDDHLMWETYAGGSEGIGITVRYGVLRDWIREVAKDLDVDGELQCGRVNYEKISLLPFNKHYMFRNENENEIRFAFRSFDSRLTLVSVEEIFGAFGVRISPAAGLDHREAIRRMWLMHGGTDRIQHPA